MLIIWLTLSCTLLMLIMLASLDLLFLLILILACHHWIIIRSSTSLIIKVLLIEILLIYIKRLCAHLSSVIKILAILLVLLIMLIFSMPTSGSTLVVLTSIIASSCGATSPGSSTAPCVLLSFYLSMMMREGIIRRSMSASMITLPLTLLRILAWLIRMCILLTIATTHCLLPSTPILLHIMVRLRLTSRTTCRRMLLLRIDYRLLR